MIFTKPRIFDSSGGTSGPNDGAYKCFSLEAAAVKLRNACEFHCGYSHSRSLTLNHPLVQAMKLLAEEHWKDSHMKNESHDPTLFEIPDLYFITPDQYWSRTDFGQFGPVSIPEPKPTPPPLSPSTSAPAL